MTHEELDKATADEAWRIMEEGQDVAVIAARLAREGWTPPEPVDPDVLAYREWMDTNPLKPRPWTEQNRYDNVLCEVFVQGARMARYRIITPAKPPEPEMTKTHEDYTGPAFAMAIKPEPDLITLRLECLKLAATLEMAQILGAHLTLEQVADLFLHYVLNGSVDKA